MSTGTLTNVGQRDWLSVLLTAGQAYEFTLSGLGDAQELQVGTATALDESTYVIGATPLGAASGGNSDAFFRPATTGTYYVDVGGDGATGDYNVVAAAVTTAFTNTTATPGQLAVGGRISSTLAYVGEHDWLAVQLTAGQAYEFTLTGLGTGESLQVGTAAALDEGGLAIGTMSTGTGSGDTNQAFFRAFTTGTYYVDVSAYGATGNYTVAAAAVTTDYTNTTATTGRLVVGGSTKGAWANVGQHDWFAVELTAGQAYEFTLTGPGISQQLYVGTAATLDFSMLSIGETSAAGLTTNTYAFFRPVTTGTYYIDAISGGLIGDYSVAAAAVTTDLTNTTATAGQLAIGGTTNGSLTNVGQHDWFAVQLTAGQAYEFTLRGLDFAKMQVGTAAALDESAFTVGELSAGVSSGSGVYGAFFRPGTTGTYYVDVDGQTQTGNYSLAAAAVTTDFTNTTATTGRLAIGGSTAGTLSYYGQHDWLAVELTAGQGYEFTLTGLGGVHMLQVGTAAALDESVLAGGRPLGTGVSGGSTAAFFRPTTSGTYYVDVGYFDFGDGESIGNYTVAAAAVTTDTTNTTATTGQISVACYCDGTLILTDDGERPVEALAIGDRVVTASGALAPIEWIGRRSYGSRFLTKQRHLLPIVFRAGSLGDDLPRRDLRVSPNHGMFLDGVLVPARCLVNGSSIVQDFGCEAVDYIHIELPQHDVIYAEGALSETFLDDNSRGLFQNAGDYRPGDQSGAYIGAYAPRVEAGAVLTALRQRLDGVGVQELTLNGSGRSIAAIGNGVSAIRIVTGTGYSHGDARRLGAAVCQISLDGVDVPLDDARLSIGWHACEDGWRWTDGGAVVLVSGARLITVSAVTVPFALAA